MPLPRDRLSMCVIVVVAFAADMTNSLLTAKLCHYIRCDIVCRPWHFSVFSASRLTWNRSPNSDFHPRRSMPRRILWDSWEPIIPTKTPVTPQRKCWWNAFTQKLQEISKSNQELGLLNFDGIAMSSSHWVDLRIENESMSQNIWSWTLYHIHSTFHNVCHCTQTTHYAIPSRPSPTHQRRDAECMWNFHFFQIHICWLCFPHSTLGIGHATSHTLNASHCMKQGRGIHHSAASGSDQNDLP